jgi:hypothetical protein
MYGFSVNVVYDISYLQIVVFGILFSSSKMGRKNHTLMNTRHPAKLKSMDRILKYLS